MNPYERNAIDFLAKIDYLVKKKFFLCRVAIK